MIDKPDPEDTRSPKFLIMDNTPLSLLGAIEALDWFFEPGCDVWITDLVLEEATREPGEGRDQRRATRNYIASWIESNRNRLTVLATAEGERYRQEMELWELAGSPERLRPTWKDRGEASLLQGVQTIKAALQSGEAIVVLVDDRDARDAIRAVRADINMMGTQTFIEWLLEDFGIAQAETAWTSILMATGNTADPGEDEDPVYIRNSP
ncbi:hypothetical protein [Phyllobacterium zundukense]|uniref:Uncharacterized protein n=1 Tax=Phyllobacterium zundukense TaxID=1867719 RepID=A0ACD4CXF2_9HYPH|nr:hypothetical protein [Phyllobacterium zundukense]UXN58249.1 hypothetical protein N8E88_05405 [Phyllobacterium zundukense]